MIESCDTDIILFWVWLGLVTHQLLYSEYDWFMWHINYFIWSMIGSWELHPLFLALELALELPQELDFSSCRQIGHEAFLFNHSLIHLSWKSCLHGKLTRFSPALYSDKQTWHCGPSLLTLLFPQYFFVDRDLRLERILLICHVNMTSM